METQITHTHNDIEIVYDEQSNTWKFTLRNRDRSAESLVKAKEMIDKPEKEKPFQKIPAWRIKYQDIPDPVEVTGIAEGSYLRDRLWVWIKGKDGKRTKETADFSIYPSTETNDGIINSMIEKEQTIRVLKKEISDLQQTLSPLKIEVPE